MAKNAIDLTNVVTPDDLNLAPTQEDRVKAQQTDERYQTLTTSTPLSGAQLQQSIERGRRVNEYFARKEEEAEFNADLQVQRARLQSNDFTYDAVAPLPDYDAFDPNSRLRYKEALKKKQEANALLSFVNYQIENNEEIKHEYEALKKQTSDPTLGLDQLKATADFKEKLINQYQSILSNGALPEYLMLDRDFRKYCTPDTVRAFMMAREEQEALEEKNGWFRKFGRMWSMESERRRAALDFKNTGDKLEFDQKMEELNLKYARSGDGQTMQGVIGSLVSMINPIIDHPLSGVLATAGAAVTGFLSKNPATAMQAFGYLYGGGVLFPDEYEQFQADMLNTALDLKKDAYLQEHPNATAEDLQRDIYSQFDRETFLNHTAGAAALSSFLDVVGDRFILSGTTAPLKAMFSDIQQKAVEAPLRKAITETAKGIAADTAVNIATEGIQDTINTAAAVNAAGEEGALEKALEAGEESLKAAIAPSAILSTVFSIPRLGHNLHTYTRDYQAKTITEQRLASNEKLAQQLDNQNIPANAKNNLYQKVFNEGDRNYSVMSFKPEQVLQTINDLGLKGEQIPTLFGSVDKIQEALDNGQEIQINRASFYAFFTKEQRDQFKNDFHYADLGEKTLKDLSKELLDQRADLIAREVQNTFAQENEEFRQSRAVSGLVQAKLIENNIGTAEEQAAAGDFAAAFVRSISEQTGIPMDEVANTYLYKINRNTKVDDLNIKEDQDDLHNKDLRGFTDAQNKVIHLNPNADLATVLEEFAHSYLLTIAQLVKDGKGNIRTIEGLKAFKNWLGDRNIDLTTVNEKNSYAHEAFVTALMQYIITGRAEKSNIAALRGFKNMLMRVASARSIYQGLKQSDFKGDRDGTKRAQLLANRYENLTNHKLNKLNGQIDTLMGAMFGQQQKLLSENERYSFGSIFEGVDQKQSKIVLEAKDHDDLQKHAEETQAKLEDSLLQAEAISNPILFEGLDETERATAAKLAGRELNTQIKPATKITKEKLAKIRELHAKLLKARKEYNKAFKAYFSKTFLADAYDTLKQGKINANDPELAQLTPKELQTLKDAGFIGDDGIFSVRDAVQGFTQFTSTAPQDLAGRFLADRFGNNSIEVLKVISRVPNTNQLASFFTGEMMKAEFQKLREDYTQADAGVYILDERLRLNTKERTILDKSVNSREEAELCKSAATSLLARTPFGSIDISNLINRAARVKKLAQQALRKGDLAQAGKYLRTERVLLEEAKQASKMKPVLEKRLNDMKEFFFKPDKELSRRSDVKILMIGRLLLSQLGLKNAHLTPENVDIRYEAIASNTDLMQFYNLIAGRTEAGTVLSGYWKNMTAQDVELASRMLQSIKQIARKNGWLRNKGRYDVSVKKVQAEMLSALNRHKNRTEKMQTDDGEGGAPTINKTRMRSWRESAREYNYSFYRPENFFQELDGQDTEGAWHKYIYTPIKNAEVHAMTELELWRKEIRAAAEKSGLKFDSNAVIDCPELEFSDDLKRATGLTHMRLGVGQNKAEETATHQLLGLMLHMGNRDNLNKLLKGYFGENVTEEQFIKWFNRMCDEGYITKQMMDYVQAVWDINKKYFEEAQKAHYDTKHYEMKIIEPRPLHTRWGDYAGGVVRAVSNDDLVTQDSMKMRDLNEFMHSVENTIPTITNGFTQERKAGAIRPLCIDPVRLIQETRNIILYSNFQPAYAEVQKVLDPDLRAELERKYPGIYEHFLKNWLITTLQQKTTAGASNGIAKGLFDKIGYVTRMTGMALMAGNINNTLQGVTNFVALATKIPLSQIALSLLRSVGRWGELRRQVDQSEFMINRLRNTNDGVENVFQDLVFSSVNFDDPKLKAKALSKQAVAWGRKHAYFMQKFLQNYIDTVAYDAAHRTALKEGKTAEQAQRYAESVVRTTQSSFDIADMANAEKTSPGMKIFTQFGGYFYTMYRLQSSQIHMICMSNKTPVHKALSIAWVITCSMIAPAIFAEAINQAMSGKDSDDEDYASALLWSVPKMYAGALPFVGKGVQYAIEKLQGKNYTSAGIMNNPTFGQFESLGRVLTKVVQGQELKPNDVKSAIMILSVLSGCPMLAWGGRMFAYSYGVEAGYYMPESAFDLLRGYATGIASPDSKR